MPGSVSENELLNLIEELAAATGTKTPTGTMLTLPILEEDSEAEDDNEYPILSNSLGGVPNNTPQTNMTANQFLESVFKKSELHHIGKSEIPIAHKCEHANCCVKRMEKKLELLYKAVCDSFMLSEHDRQALFMKEWEQLSTVDTPKKQPRLIRPDTEEKK